MTSLSDDNQADIIESCNSTSRYFDTLFNIVSLFRRNGQSKLILQIPRPPFWIFIYLFLMVLFSPKLMINTINFLSWMSMFYVSPLSFMECIFLNSKIC